MSDKPVTKAFTDEQIADLKRATTPEGGMEITIRLDETLTVAARIEGVTNPTRNQAEALKEIAATVSNYRHYLIEPVE